ncbi:MAG: PAC2 family protein, partial [Thermoplasmata archaeon]
MENVVVRMTQKVQPKDPVLVEGLPGVGNVGKLAADYLKETLPAVPFATLYSKFFPPQVYVREDGTIRLVAQEISYYKARAPEER